MDGRQYLLREYFTWLYTYKGTEKIAIVLDQYPTHELFVEEMKKINNEAQFIFVPDNSTDVLQHLDRKVFGVLKSKGRKKKE